MATYCLLDCQTRADGDITAATRVAGLSLLARHIRRSARLGWAGAVIVADGDTRALCERALRREPPPETFEVDYLAPGSTPIPPGSPGPPGPSDDVSAFVELDLCAIYDADSLRAAARDDGQPEPVITIASRADIAAAERMLYRNVRKSIDQDGVVAFYTFRVLSGFMTRALIDTPITPNHVSLTAMALGLAAAVCAALGTTAGLIAAGVLFWLGAVIDCVDGEIARLRIKGSKLGEWLDSMADEVSTYGLLLGLGIGLHTMGYDPFWTRAAYVGFGVGLVVNIKQYSDLYRAGLHIDTAQYPWFFGDPSEAPADPGLWSHLVRWFGFAFRRDAFVTATAIMLIAGVPHWAVALLTGGALFVTVLLVVHLLVIAGRGRSA